MLSEYKHIGPETITPLQREFMDSTAEDILFGGAAGGGKEAPLDSIVITPFGPKLMGDIKVGDQVSNPDGTIAKVIGVWPQGIKDIYRVSFDDGASCEVGLEHLWKIRQPRIRRFRKKPITPILERWEIATTAQVLQRMQSGQSLVIPLSEPAQFTTTSRNKDSRWPVPPYTLGAFIGDGSLLGSINLTSADPEVIERVVEESGITYSSTNKRSLATTYYFSRDLKNKFSGLGLLDHRSWEKFIPHQYKLAPLEMRWALINGLFDTDGFVDTRGHVSYTTTSERLAQDVRWLAHSLGFKANTTTQVPTYTYHGEKKEGRLAYTIWLKGKNRDKVFSIQRKKLRSKIPYNNGQSEEFRKIVKIELSRQAEAQCITVNNPNGLYLTDDFIVTHNSYVLFWNAVAFCWRYPGLNAVIFRRHYSELKDKLIPYAMELDGVAGTWRASDYDFFFDNRCREGCVHGLPVKSHGPSVLHFRHAEYDQDILQYKGADFHFVGFDELTSFSDYQIKFVIGRCMRGPLYYPRVVRSTSNPDGVSTDFVKARYIDPDVQIVRKIQMLPHTHSEGKWEYECNYSHRIWQPYEDGQAVLTRQFIPSSWRDNIFIDRAEYDAALNLLPEPLRSAQKEGSWDLTVSMAFPEFDRKKHVVAFDEGEDAEDLMERFKTMPKSAGVDYGYAPDPWATVFVAHDYSIRHPKDPTLHRVYVYDEFCENYILASDQAMKIYDKGPFRAVVGGSDMSEKNRGISQNEISPMTIYKSYGLPFVVFPLAARTRAHRKDRLHNYLSTAPDGKPYLIIHPRCKQLISSLPKLVTDPNDPTDIKHSTGVFDHPYDALTMLLASTSSTVRNRPGFLPIRLRN